MATAAAAETVKIKREDLNWQGGRPGDLLTDDQIKGLQLYKETIANLPLVSFTAEREGHMWEVQGLRDTFDQNVANFQRLVRTAQINARTVVPAAAPSAPSPLPAPATAAAVSAQPQPVVRCTSISAVESMYLTWSQVDNIAAIILAMDELTIAGQPFVCYSNTPTLCETNTDLFPDHHAS